MNTTQDGKLFAFIHDCRQCRFSSSSAFTRNGTDRFLTWKCMKDNHEITYGLNEYESVPIPKWCPENMDGKLVIQE